MLTFQAGANIVRLCSWLNTHPDEVSQFLVHVLAQIFHFTHISIPFILRLFNYIQNNFGALNWFDSFIKRFLKRIGLYQSRDLHLCRYHVYLSCNCDYNLHLANIVCCLLLRLDKTNSDWVTQDRTPILAQGSKQALIGLPRIGHQS